MPHLVDMTRTATETGEATVLGAPEKEKFSFGLRIDLNNEELDKLNMSKLPEVGDELVMQAEIKVISVRESADENDNERNVELQITALSLDAKAGKSSADILYSNGGENV